VRLDDAPRDEAVPSAEIAELRQRVGELQERASEQQATVAMQERALALYEYAAAALSETRTSPPTVDRPVEAPAGAVQITAMELARALAAVAAAAPAPPVVPTPVSERPAAVAAEVAAALARAEAAEIALALVKAAAVPPAPIAPAPTAVPPAMISPELAAAYARAAAAELALAQLKAAAAAGPVAAPAAPAPAAVRAAARTETDTDKSVENYHRNVRSFGKAPRFTGEVAMLESFLHAFTKYCRSVECPPSLCVRLLEMNVPNAVNTAMTFIHKTTVANLEEMCERLRTHYYGRNQADYNEDVAKSVKQAPGESTDALAARLQLAVSLANASSTRIDSDSAVRLYARALSDTHLGDKLRRALRDDVERGQRGEPPRYPHFEDYVTFAGRYETHQSDGAASKPAPEAQAVPRPSAKAAQIAAVAAVPAVAPAAMSLADFSPELLQQLKATITAGSTRRARDGRPREQMTCFNCDKQGHRSADCPEPFNADLRTKNFQVWLRARIEKQANKPDGDRPRRDDQHAAPDKPAAVPKVRAAAAAAKNPLN
jgi:hypothetical protein